MGGGLGGAMGGGGAPGGAVGGGGPSWAIWGVGGGGAQAPLTTPTLTLTLA